MSWFYHPWPADEAAPPSGSVFGGPRVRLADPLSSLQVNRRRRQFSRYIYPIVVDGAPDALGGVGISLASQEAARKARRPRGRVRPPVVVTQGVAFYPHPVSVNLTRRRATVRTTSFLLPPTDTKGLEDQGAVAVTLVRNAPRPTVALLRPPAVVAPVLASPIRLSLTRTRIPQSASLLRPPLVVAEETISASVSVTLAPSRRGTPRSSLGAPVVVLLAVEIYGPSVQLARIRPVPTLHRLGAPIDTVGLEDQGRVVIHLAPSPRQPRSTHSFLLPPSDVVDRDDLGEVRITLAASPRQARAAHWLLGKPTDTVGQEDAGSVSVTLVRIRPVRTLARVAPPVVVFPFLARKVAATLAYSRRGRPLSRLRPPALIDLRPQTYFLSVTLVRNAPRPTTTLLRPPTVSRPANPPVDETILVSLVRIRPARTRALLRKPVVVFPFLARPVRVELAPQRRGRPLSRLAPPAVVREFFVRPIVVSLAPQSRRRGVALLAPPAVVARAQAEVVSVTLAPSRRGRALTLLRPPAVIETKALGRVSVTLARIRPRPTVTLLFAPVVIDLSPQVYELRITLAPSRSGLPISLRIEPAAFIEPPPAPAGEVCGGDSAGGGTIEGGDSTASEICTDESEGVSASGASASPSTIRGTESTGGSVSGTDGKAT